MNRCFFALWPDDATRARLAAAMLPLVPAGCRAVPTANLHLTLVFVGAVADERIAELAGCGRLVFEPFSLRFGATGSFPRARVAWVAPVDPPPALFDLHRTLATRVAAAGFPVERRAYSPHVTIARPCTAAPGEWDAPPLDWTVTGVALCRSESTPAGVRYSVVAMP